MHKVPRLLNRRKRLEPQVSAQFAVDQADDGRAASWLRDLIERAKAAKTMSEQQSKEAA